MKTKPNTMETAADFLGYLCERWQDEREYEDFSEYKKAMQKNMPAGMTIISFTKRPFRIIFRLADGQRKWMNAAGHGGRITWGGFQA